IILLSFDISIGTVSPNSWKSYLDEIAVCINKTGSLIGFINLDNSNEITIRLILNFIYHDILSSTSIESGTYFPIEDYFNLSIIDNNMDSLQGCNKILYLIIGDINKLTMQISEYNKMDKNLTFQIDFYSNLEDILIPNIINRIDTAIPQTTSVMFLNSKLEMEVHLTTFELLQNTLKLLILHAIKNLPPISFEIQLLILKIFPLIDIIIGTRLQSKLIFCLLILGANCFKIQHRKRFLNQIKRYCEMGSFYYKAGNIEKILKIIKQCWVKNKNGNKSIHWWTIAKDFGWEINLGD
ncbi:fungal specific transcription factor domain-containing protein ASCRUDRAFT_29440, partial [Ascoidea rubescens DSM 1968]